MYWSFRRYLVISRPLQARKPTRAGACYAVFFIWVYSAIFASLPLFGIGKYVPEGYLTSCSFDYLSEDDATRVFILAFFVAAWVIPLTVIASCYTAIVRYVYLAKREISSLHDTARDGQVIAQPGCQNSSIFIFFLCLGSCTYCLYRIKFNIDYQLELFYIN